MQTPIEQPITSRRILVAPLNWGLGHAARCIPIIEALERYGFTPILASDGQARSLLQKEFAHLQILELPSYDIEYANDRAGFKWQMLKNVPTMVESILKEKKIVKKWVGEYNLDGIISDNRPGVISKKVPSVFITHQLNVLSGSTTWFSGKLHRLIIEKFTECWVPDFKGLTNLTGKLGHLTESGLEVKYIGPLSRLKKVALPIKYNLMVLLSGPEPQRTHLEKILKKQVLGFKGKVIFISGVVAPEQKTSTAGHVTFYNFMTRIQLEQAMNESALVLCRSGYTTIMDLAKLGKPAFFIPTPGQYEQEYLAKKFKKQGIFTYATQDKFEISNLFEAEVYKGLPDDLILENDWDALFGLFKCKGEL